jgi:hypothetical protein
VVASIYLLSCTDKVVDCIQTKQDKYVEDNPNVQYAEFIHKRKSFEVECR